MNTQKKKVLFTVITILAFWVSVSTTVKAQGDSSGFSEDFDTINWEQWEQSQDVTVEGGVLRINSGNFVVRIGDWSDIDLDLRLRIQSPGEVVVNSYMRDEGHYALVLTGKMLILDKFVDHISTPLSAVELQNFNEGDWNDINIKVEGDNHTITINRVVAITVADSEPLTTGAIMLHVLGEATVEYDSLSLSGIPGSELDGQILPQDAGEPAVEGEIIAAEQQPGDAGAETGVPAVDITPVGSGGDLGSWFEELVSGQSNQFELSTFFINLILAVIASFILGRVYIYWGSSLSNRRAFASNFMLLTVTTTFIILIVRSSVALSLGLVGALSIVRFRAAVKEPEELTYLFFAISMGIGLGDDQRLITLLALLVAIMVMGLLRLFRNTQADVNLHLTIASQNPGKVALDQITTVLQKHCSKIKLLRFDETEDVLEISYVIEFKRVSDLSHAKVALQTLSPSVAISFLDNKGIW